MDFNAHLDPELLQHMKLFSRENCTWQRRMWREKKKKKTRNQVSASRARAQKTFVCGTGVSLVQSSALLVLAPVHSCMLVGVSRAGSIRGYKSNTQVRNWMEDKQRAFFLLLVQLAAAEGPDSKKVGETWRNKWETYAGKWSQILWSQSHRATGNPAPSKNSKLTCCRRATSGINILPLKHMIRYLFHEMFNSNNSTRLNLF